MFRYVQTILVKESAPLELPICAAVTSFHQLFGALLYLQVAIYSREPKPKRGRQRVIYLAALVPAVAMATAGYYLADLKSIASAIGSGQQLARARNEAWSLREEIAVAAEANESVEAEVITVEVDMSWIGTDLSYLDDYFADVFNSSGPGAYLDWCVMATACDQVQLLVHSNEFCGSLVFALRWILFAITVSFLLTGFLFK